MKSHVSEIFVKKTCVYRGVGLFFGQKLKVLALVRSPQTAYRGLNHGLRFLRDFTHGKITEVPSHYTQSLPIRNTLIRNDPSNSLIIGNDNLLNHEKQIVILTTKQLKYGF